MDKPQKARVEICHRDTLRTSDSRAAQIATQDPTDTVKIDHTPLPLWIMSRPHFHAPWPGETAQRPTAFVADPGRHKR